MKRMIFLFVAAMPFILLAILSSAEPANAECPAKELDPSASCGRGRGPRSTPTPTAPGSTAIPVPPSTQVKSLPARSADGTYYITDPGVYSGNATCGNIPAAAYCVHIWESGGVTLQDFTITTAQGAGLQIDNNSIIRRGTIKAPNGAATGWHKANVTIDGVRFDSPVGGLGFLGGGCENTSPRPNRNITIRNSTFVNSTGSEMLYLKCAQDVLIEGNNFAPASQWGVSTPDGVNIIIRANYFNLWSEPNNWLAIELPRTFGVDVIANTVVGPAGDWFVYVNSGTNDLTISDNCVGAGIGVMHELHQSGGVTSLVMARNGPC